MTYKFNEIMTILSKKYKKIGIDNKDCFKLDDGTIFKLSLLKDFNAFVVEYAMTDEDALNNLFEDGDLIDFNLPIEEIIYLIIEEIEM